MVTTIGNRASLSPSGFGFYGVRHRGRTHMYMHGLTPAKTLMEREGLLNCAAYMLEIRALDDPWAALKRLLRGKSQSLGADLFAVCRSPGLLAKGIGTRVLESGVISEGVKEKIISALIGYNPNFVVREYRNRGSPISLMG